MEMDIVLVGAASAMLGSVLTFLTNNRDSSTKANSTAVDALSVTIDQLRRQIDHLENQLHELDERFSRVMADNEALVTELHNHRKLLANYRSNETAQP